MMSEALRERVADAIREAANELEGGHGWPEYAAEEALAVLGLNDLDAAVERGARGLHLDYKREGGRGSPNRALSRENLRRAWDEVVIKSWYRRKATAVLEAALSLGLPQQTDAVAIDATIRSSDAQDTDTGVRGADAACVALPADGVTELAGRVGHSTVHTDAVGERDGGHGPHHALPASPVNSAAECSSAPAEEDAA